MILINKKSKIQFKIQIYKFIIFNVIGIFSLTLGLSCKSSDSVNTKKTFNIKDKYKFVFYPVVSENQEFSNKLLSALREVVEYNFSQEVFVQNYIPQTDENISYDIDTSKAIKAIICHIKSLGLFYPQKIYFRCYVFKKSDRSQNIDITKKLLQVKEEIIKEEKTDSYKYFDIFIDLNDKTDLEESAKIVQQHTKERVFLAEHLFLKQDNFFLVIKEKFADVAKNYLFDDKQK